MTATTKSASVLLRRSAIVGSGTLLSRITGLLRVGVTVAVLGGTWLGDTYNRSNSTPNIVYELLLGGVLTASLLPIFVSARDDDDRSAIAAVFTAALTVLGVVTIIALLFAPAISSFLAGNVDPIARADTVRVGTTLVRIFVPQMLFYGFTALATAALNARHRFVAAAYAPVLNNVVVITMLLLIRSELPKCTEQDRLCGLRYASQHEGFTNWLGFGTTLGIVAMAVALVVPLRRLNTPLFAGISAFRHPAVARMVRLSGWTIGYVVANQIALLYITRLAGATGGAFVQYQAAFMFFQLPHGLLAVSIMTAIAPELASAAQRPDPQEFLHRFVDGIRLLVFAMIPATGIIIAFAPSMTNLLSNGQFTRAAAWQTSRALIGMACGLVPFSLYLYTLRAFYARGDTRTPFIINCVENAINIVLAMVLFEEFGVAGLGFAYGASYAVAACIALIALQQRVGHLALAPLRTVFAKVLVATVVAATVGWLVARTNYDSLPRSAGAGTATLLTFFVAARVLRLQEFSGFLTAIRGRRGSRV
jgi:putative peptidoglycan lipid II flippase